MCETPSWNLNPNPDLPHPTNIYTCGVTIAPRLYGGKFVRFNTKENGIFVCFNYVCVCIIWK